MIAEDDADLERQIAQNEALILRFVERHPEVVAAVIAAVNKDGPHEEKPSWGTPRSPFGA